MPQMLPTSRDVNRWDVIKCIALFTMFADHAGHFYFTDAMYLNAIGRNAAFVFLFLTGFAKHYRFDRFLLLLATLLTVNDWLVGGHINTLNILFTIIFIRMLLHWMEAHHKIKLRLHEWVIGSVVIFASMCVMQYGSIGVLIAISGYVFKHRNQYATTTPKRFLDVVLLIYGIFMGWSFEFTPSIWVLMAATLLATRWLLLWLVADPMKTPPLPKAVKSVMKTASHYSASIYVIHLMILGWLTGIAL